MQFVTIVLSLYFLYVYSKTITSIISPIKATELDYPLTNQYISDDTSVNRKVFYKYQNGCIVDKRANPACIVAINLNKDSIKKCSDKKKTDIKCAKYYYVLRSAYEDANAC